MNAQLQEISKTISLATSHSAYQFNVLTDHCPRQLIVISCFDQYILKANLISKKIKSPLQGIFQQILISIHQNETSEQRRIYLKKDNNSHHNCWTNDGPINTNTLSKLIVKKQMFQNQQLHQFKYNQNVDFDMKAIGLLKALGDQQNIQFDCKKCKIIVKSLKQQWEIPVKSFYSKQQRILSQKDTVCFIKTRQYLAKIQNQLRIDKSSIVTQHQAPIGQLDKSNAQLSQNKDKKVDNKHLLQKINILQKQLQKNTYLISQVELEIHSVRKQISIYGEKMEIHENKLMKIWDDLNQLKKQNQAVSGVSHQKKKNQVSSPVTVPDFIREKLSIDLHSSYLGKFDVTGSQIIYKGEDKQATQLLSNKIFGIQNKNKKLKSTMKVIKTRSKCIKMGIIDNKYVNERSCWNFPHIIYLHGWGHTMISGRQQNHQFCDFGTGDYVQMQVDFESGFIKWMINHKTGTKLHTQPVRKLLKSDINWTPFIAMYNYLDCVEWNIQQLP